MQIRNTPDAVQREQQIGDAPNGLSRTLPTALISGAILLDMPDNRTVPETPEEEGTQSSDLFGSSHAAV
jgi:hypothetical protein